MTDKQVLGVIGAMDSKIGYLVERLENSTVSEKYGYSFYSGTLRQKHIVVVKCRVGKVNAARCTQILIDHFTPAAVINTGIAGALDPTLNIGDAVVAAGFVQHDFDATAFGYARGYLCTGKEHDRPTVFYPDSSLAAAISAAARGVLPDADITDGVVATGDLFVSAPDIRRDIRNTFGASCAEMEGAAVAQVASYAGVPFAALRIISDRADGEAAESFERFEWDAAKKSAMVIEELLRAI